MKLSKNQTLLASLTYFFVTWIICFRFIIGDYLPLPLDNYLLIDKGALNQDKWTVKNQLVADSSYQMYPWKKLIIESYKKGEIPTFNPYIIMGNSLVGNGQSAPFYPGNLLFIFGLNTGWKILFFSQFFLASLFTFLFLKAIRFRFFSSLLGGFIYGYSGFFAAWGPWTTVGHTILWLPLMFLSVYKFSENLKFRWLVVLSIIIYCSLTAGFPQFSLYMIVSTLAYFLFLGIKKKTLFFSKYWILGTLSFIWGFGLAALQLLPIISLLSLSNRISQYKLHDFSGVPAEHLLTMLVPGFFGWPNDAFYFGAQNFNETANYFGIISLFLLLLAISTWRNLKTVIFWLILFLTTLILSFDNFISHQLSQIHALIFGRGLGGRLFILTIFSGAILAAKGFEVFILNKKDRYQGLVILFSLIVILMVIKLLSVFRYFLFPESLVVYKLEFIDGETTIPLILLCTLVFLRLFSNNIKNIFLSFVLVALTTLELLLVVNKVTPWTPASLLSTSEVGQLQSQLSDPIAKTIGSVSIGEYVLFQIPGFEGYDSIYPKSYLGFLKENCGTETKLFTNWVYIDEVSCLPILQKTGLKYLVDKNELFITDLNRRWGKEKIANELRLVDKRADISIYEFENFQQPVVFAKQPGIVNAFSGGPNIFNLEINSPIAQNIIIYMNFLDGWNAKINNRKVFPSSDEYGFITLYIPQGISQIRLEYFPESLIRGLLVSAGFATTAITFLFIKRKQF